MALSYVATEDCVRAQHSLPYSITLLTQLLYTLPLVMSGTDCEVSTGNNSQNFLHADFTLTVELSSHPPPAQNI